jgi:glycerol-3-phosphate cytidylyltransferase
VVRGVVITYTGGTFDVLHVGHLELLAACRTLAGPDGRVVVSLNDDPFIRSYKGRPPVHSYEHRAELLSALRLVDLVVRNTGGADSGPAIEVVNPDVIVIGDDWLDPGHDETRYHAQLGVTAEWLEERGLKIVYVPRTRGVSTTALREALDRAEAEGYATPQPPAPQWRIEDGRVVRG